MNQIKRVSGGSDRMHQGSEDLQEPTRIVEHVHFTIQPKKKIYNGFIIAFWDTITTFKCSFHVFLRFAKSS